MSTITIRILQSTNHAMNTKYSKYSGSVVIPFCLKPYRFSKFVSLFLGSGVLTFCKFKKSCYTQMLIKNSLYFDVLHDFLRLCQNILPVFWTLKSRTFEIFKIEHYTQIVVMFPLAHSYYCISTLVFFRAPSQKR